MFTGIVEEIGLIKSIHKGGSKQRITIACKKILEDIHLGDSISVNGICLTVVEYSFDSFSADVMNETFSRSSLGELKGGSPVNLERAMAADGRFGGHIVSGHIDGVGTIIGIRKDDNAVWFEVAADADILNGIVMKGSIAIDGISLTVAAVDSKSFKVSIIPHTLKETILGTKSVRDKVNLENDLIGKYVQKMLIGQLDKPNNSITSKADSCGLTKELLLANGF